MVFILNEKNCSSDLFKLLFSKIFRAKFVVVCTSTINFTQVFTNRPKLNLLTE